MQTTSSCNENEDYFNRNGKKIHGCTFPGCGKIFPYKSELARHIYIHTLERPAQCPFANCTKTFKREDALRNHVRIHTGETPYECGEPDCGRGFVSKAALRYHSLTHKTEREYRCTFPGCNKEFLTISQLKQHENSPNCHVKKPTRAKMCESNVSNFEIKKSIAITEDESMESKSNEVEWRTEDEEVKEYFERMVKAILKANNGMKSILNQHSIRNEPIQMQIPNKHEENILAFLKLNK